VVVTKRYFLGQAMAMGNGSMGKGQWAMGNGRWAMGNGRWAMGNGQWAMGNRQLTISQSPNCQFINLQSAIVNRKSDMLLERPDSSPAGDAGRSRWERYERKT
jgi:hypothetical protein